MFEAIPSPYRVPVDGSFDSRRRCDLLGVVLETPQNAIKFLVGELEQSREPRERSTRLLWYCLPALVAKVVLYFGPRVLQY